MRHFNEIECFVKAVELKSLTAAAKALKLPKSNISRKIKNLAERVGMTPLTRTTRASHLAGAGRLYFEKAALALKQLAVAEEMPVPLTSPDFKILRPTTLLVEGNHG